jgi:CRP-like cAMP-binding protein
MLEKKIELLKNLPVFRELNQDQLRAIVDASSKSFFEPGDAVIAAYTHGDAAHLILSGTAACCPDSAAFSPKELLGPGVLIGELAMLVETTHTLTVRAKERLRTLTITRSALLEVMKTDGVIAEKIATYLVARLRELASQMRNLNGTLAPSESAAPKLAEKGVTPLITYSRDDAASAIRDEFAFAKRQKSKTG